MLGAAGVLVQEVVRPDIFWYNAGLPENVPNLYFGGPTGKVGRTGSTEPWRVHLRQQMLAGFWSSPHDYINNLERPGCNSDLRQRCTGEPRRPAGMGVPAHALGGGPPVARYPQARVGE